MSGWMIPLALIDCASSSIFSGSKIVRGCDGFACIWLVGSVVGLSGVTGGVATGGVTGPLVGRLGNSADSPLPSALRLLSGPLVICQDLLCQLYIRLRPFG